jgi:hypothetical protein
LSKAARCMPDCGRMTSSQQKNVGGNHEKYIKCSQPTK